MRILFISDFSSGDNHMRWKKYLDKCLVGDKLEDKCKIPKKHSEKLMMSKLPSKDAGYCCLHSRSQS